MKFNFFLALFLFLTTDVMSQSAPVAAEPAKDNKILIDSLMEVSGYKVYFIQYCDRQIDNAGKVNKWTFDETRARKLKVNFDEFKKYTIYNWFSRLSREDLLNLINIIGKLNAKNQYSSGFFVTHSGIQSNLELFVKEYLK